MKKTIEKETHFCDSCGKEEGQYIYTCDECGKELCFDCRKTQAKEYPHSVSCSGSGDGLYCVECDAKLLKAGTNKRHQAFRGIERLRLESRAFYEDFKNRCEVAEKLVQSHARAR